MIPQLDALLPLPKSNQFILISEDETVDGSFLLHHFLSQAQLNQKKSLMLSFTQIPHHYISIQKKIGTWKEGTIQFVDGLSGSSEYHFSLPDIPNVKKNGELTLPSEPAQWSQFILNIIEEQQIKFVFIDGLSLMNELLTDQKILPKLLYELLINCQLNDRQLFINISNQSSLFPFLLHQCHYLLQVKGMESGFKSHEIDGQLILQRGSKWQNQSQIPFSNQSLHYKRFDSRVKLYGKGLSIA